MFDWALFEALEMYLKWLTHDGEFLPLSALLVLSDMRFAFFTLVVVAALWTIQYSDHVAVIFDNTIDLMLEFQVSLQQISPGSCESSARHSGGGSSRRL